MSFFPRKRLFWAVSLGHMTNDMFMSMGPVLLIFISAHLFPISNTQIGIAVSAMQLMGSVSQPFFGWLSDRRGGRLLGAGGVAWTVTLILLSMALATLTNNFWLMVVPYALAALGSGAFHPVGATHAVVGEERRAARNLSVFFLMGQVGLALGPAVAGILLDQATTDHTLFTAALGPAFAAAIPEQGSLTPLFILMLAALPGVMLMAFTLPRAPLLAEARPAGDGGAAGSPFAKVALRPLIILVLMVTLRSLAQPGSVAFVPILFERKGWDPAQYGLIAGLFWMASGIAGVIFGNLADRYDRRHVVTISMVLSGPAFLLLPLSDGAAAFALAMAAGGLSGGSHSIIVVLAQEIIPTSKGFASGAILGFIFGTGAMGTLLIGAISDQIGLASTFQLVAGVIVVAGVLAVAIPHNRVQKTYPLPEVSEKEPLPSGAHLR